MYIHMYIHTLDMNLQVHAPDEVQSYLLQCVHHQSLAILAPGLSDSPSTYSVHTQFKPPVPVPISGSPSLACSGTVHASSSSGGYSVQGPERNPGHHETQAPRHHALQHEVRGVSTYLPTHM